MYKRIAVLMGVVVLMMVSTLGQESSNAKTLPAKPIKKKTTDKTTKKTTDTTTKKVTKKPTSKKSSNTNSDSSQSLFASHAK